MDVEEFNARATLTANVKRLKQKLKKMKDEQVQMKSQLTGSESNEVKLKKRVSELEARKFTREHQDKLFENTRRGVQSANEIGS